MIKIKEIVFNCIVVSLAVAVVFLTRNILWNSLLDYISDDSVVIVVTKPSSTFVSFMCFVLLSCVLTAVMVWQLIECLKSKSQIQFITAVFVSIVSMILSAFFLKKRVIMTAFPSLDDPMELQALHPRIEVIPLVGLVVFCLSIYFFYRRNKGSRHTL